jgi:photosystem II stability/assembly factor-like uncharacterized protein
MFRHLLAVRTLLVSLLVSLLAAALLACSDGDDNVHRISDTPPLNTQIPPPGLRCTHAVQHGPDRTEVTASSDQGCWLPTGFEDMSPSIQVSHEGVLFVARSSQGLLRSDDEGLTWTEVAVPALGNGDRHADGIHGYVHIDPRTDRIWYATSMSAASCGASLGAVLSWSDDLGESWMGTPLACDTYDWGKIVTGPAPDGNEYPSAAYFLGVGIRPIGGQRFVYRSLDGGQTWERMNNIASATTEAGVGAAAPDGTVYFDYPEFTGFDPTRLENTTYPWIPENECRQMIAVSEDFGVTWRQEPVPQSLACGHLYGQQRVAVDEEGTVYVVWIDDTDSQLYMSTSEDRARSWSKPVNVMAPGTAFSLTHANIVAAERGHVFIAALQTTLDERPPSPPGYPGIYGGPAHAVLSESWDANTVRPTFTTVDLDAQGDQSLDTGESSNEANAYLAMSANGQGWAIFSRHTPSFAQPGLLFAARIYHAGK